MHFVWMPVKAGGASPMKVCRLIEDLIHLHFSEKVGSLCRLCWGKEWIPEKRHKMAFTHATYAAYPIFSSNAPGCITGPVHCMRVPQISVAIFQSCQFFFCGFSSQFSPNHMSSLRYQVWKRESCLTARFPLNLIVEWWHGLSFLQRSFLVELFPCLGKKRTVGPALHIRLLFLKKTKQKKTICMTF